MQFRIQSKAKQGYVTKLSYLAIITVLGVNVNDEGVYHAVLAGHPDPQALLYVIPVQTHGFGVTVGCAAGHMRVLWH